MCRTSIVCLVLVFGLVSTTYGSHANIDPFADFENNCTWGASPSQTTRGWAICQWGTQGDCAATAGPQDPLGVTHGTGSAKTVKTLNHLDTGGKTWGWNVEFADWTGSPGGETATNFRKDMYAAIENGEDLMFDVTYDPTLMTDLGLQNHWFDSQAFLQIGYSGGQVSEQWEQLAPWDGLSVQTKHVALDTTQLRDIIGVINLPADITYIQLIFGWEAGPSWGGKGTVYYDNVKMETIPEPATMALLGLGALALIRRKR